MVGKWHLLLLLLGGRIDRILGSKTHGDLLNRLRVCACVEYGSNSSPIWHDRLSPWVRVGVRKTGVVIDLCYRSWLDGARLHHQSHLIHLAFKLIRHQLLFQVALSLVVIGIRGLWGHRDVLKWSPSVSLFCNWFEIGHARLHSNLIAEELVDVTFFEQLHWLLGFNGRKAVEVLTLIDAGVELRVKRLIMHTHTAWVSLLLLVHRQQISILLHLLRQVLNYSLQLVYQLVAPLQLLSQSVTPCSQLLVFVIRRFYQNLQVVARVLLHFQVFP